MLSLAGYQLEHTEVMLLGNLEALDGSCPMKDIQIHLHRSPRAEVPRPASRASVHIGMKKYHFLSPIESICAL